VEAEALEDILALVALEQLLLSLPMMRGQG
jgi:hypothetical protein